MRQPDRLPPDRIDTFDAAGLTLMRAWHPSAHQPSGITMRTFGPLFRFDPHAPDADGLPADHGPDGPTVWYGSLLVDTAVCETLARGAPVVDICAQLRLSVVTIPPSDPLPTVDLTDAGLLGSIGAPDRVGDDADVDYVDTQSWGRWLAAIDGVHAARYWSARHRAADGGRHGINTVIWRAPDGWAEHDRHRVVDDAVWPYVTVALDHANVAWQRTHNCPACTPTR